MLEFKDQPSPRHVHGRHEVAAQKAQPKATPRVQHTRADNIKNKKIIILHAPYLHEKSLVSGINVLHTTNLAVENVANTTKTLRPQAIIILSDHLGSSTVALRGVAGRRLLVLLVLVVLAINQIALSV